MPPNLTEQVHGTTPGTIWGSAQGWLWSTIFQEQNTIFLWVTTETEYNTPKIGVGVVQSTGLIVRYTKA